MWSGALRWVIALPSGGSPILAEAGPWVLQPAGEDGSDKQLFTLILFFSLIVRVVVASWASHQIRQHPKDGVTEGWGKGRPWSPQKLLPFAHLPALAETVTQAQTTPWEARISATINHRLLCSASVPSHLPHLPPSAVHLLPS
jgi:hypothetical protein